MFIAEMSPLETAGAIGGLIFGSTGTILWIISLLKPQQTVLSPQPLMVEMVQALHKEFASKSDFDKLVEINSERHADLYARVELARNISRQELTHEIGEINKDRRDTLEKLNGQFTFIRESLAALNEKTRHQ